MKRVFYNSHGDAALYAMIREAAGEGVEVATLERDDDAERLAKAAEADAIVVGAAPLRRPVIAAARRLAFVQHQGVGYHDTVDIDALRERAVPLAITEAGTTVPVAEHCVMLILAVLRRLPFADAELRQGRFHVNALRAVSRGLAGRRVGLVGFGRIGRAVAARLRPFDVQLAYYDPRPAAPAEDAELGVRRAAFDEILAESEIVSLHLPLTAATARLVDAAALARMRSDAFLVNTSRGGLLDEAALVEALRSGRLAGAALDVFETEPPRPDHPLYGMSNVVLTPHISAGVRDAFMDKMRFVFANLRRFWAGEPVENLVDLGAGAGRAA
jgi:phosphoglycerate dehydrogenase-like enzyme